MTKRIHCCPGGLPCAIRHQHLFYSISCIGFLFPPPVGHLFTALPGRGLAHVHHYQVVPACRRGHDVPPPSSRGRLPNGRKRQPRFQNPHPDTPSLELGTKREKQKVGEVLKKREKQKVSSKTGPRSAKPTRVARRDRGREREAGRKGHTSPLSEEIYGTREQRDYDCRPRSALLEFPCCQTTGAANIRAQELCSSKWLQALVDEPACRWSFGLFSGLCP